MDDAMAQVAKRTGMSASALYQFGMKPATADSGMGRDVGVFKTFYPLALGEMKSYRLDRGICEIAIAQVGIAKATPLQKGFGKYSPRKICTGKLCVYGFCIDKRAARHLRTGKIGMMQYCIIENRILDVCVHKYGTAELDTRKNAVGQCSSGKYAIRPIADENRVG